MYYVYVLQDANGKRYKGITSDLENRLRGHRSKNTKSTRNMSDISVIYYETTEDRISTRKREEYLKSAAGRAFLKKIV